MSELTPEQLVPLAHAVVDALGQVEFDPSHVHHEPRLDGWAAEVERLAVSSVEELALAGLLARRWRQRYAEAVEAQRAACAERGLDHGEMIAEHEAARVPLVAWRQWQDDRHRKRERSPARVWSGADVDEHGRVRPGSKGGPPIEVRPDRAELVRVLAIMARRWWSDLDEAGRAEARLVDADVVEQAVREGRPGDVTPWVWAVCVDDCELVPWERPGPPVETVVASPRPAPSPAPKPEPRPIRRVRAVPEPEGAEVIVFPFGGDGPVRVRVDESGAPVDLSKAWEPNQW